MRVLWLLASILLWGQLSGCACPEVADMVRYAEFDLSTPENALEYFREALLRDEARHQYLLFSEDLKRYVQKEEGQTLSLSNYLLVRDDMRSYLEREVGHLDDIRIGEARYVPHKPYLAEVDLTEGARKSTIRLIRQATCTIYLVDEEPVTGNVLPTQNPAVIKDGQLLLKLLIKQQKGRILPDHPEIYRVSYFREWKILDLKDSPFSRKMGSFLKQRLQEREKQQRQKEGAPKTPEM